MERATGLRELLARAEQPPVGYLIIALGVIVLLWLELVLCAAALPLMAYWHYSARQEDGGGGEPEACGEPEAEADDDHVFPADADLDSHFRLKQGGDPYDHSFWSADSARAPRRNAPRRDASRAARPKASAPGVGGVGPPGDNACDNLLDWDLDFAPAPSKGDSLGSSSWHSDSFAGGGEADLLGGFGLGLVPGDSDLFGLPPSGRGMGKGKGKGNSKGGDKGGDKGGPHDPMVLHEADPKQVFVANVGDMLEDDIQAFFENVGEVDRLKVLRNPDGTSRGSCFVTFRTEEQARKALGLHRTVLEGRSLVIRLARAGMKSGNKGGAAFGDGERERSDPGLRGGKGGKRVDWGELDELLGEALADSDGPAVPSDFNFTARRFLLELRSQDRSDGTDRFRSALDMVVAYTSSKDRSSVHRWPSYIFTLLQKFDPILMKELLDAERDAERRRENDGSGGLGGCRERRPLD